MGGRGEGGGRDEGEGGGRERRGRGGKTKSFGSLIINLIGSKSSSFPPSPSPSSPSPSPSPPSPWFSCSFLVCFPIPFFRGLFVVVVVDGGVGGVGGVGGGVGRATQPFIN